MRHWRTLQVSHAKNLQAPISSIILPNHKRRVKFIRKCSRKDLLPILHLRFAIKTASLPMYYSTDRFIKMIEEMYWVWSLSPEMLLPKNYFPNILLVLLKRVLTHWFL